MTATILRLVKNKIFINGSWLYILQVFNTIIPLLTLPYITRVLGPSQYGIFSFSLVLISYFQVVVDYGFNLTGARKIALTDNKNDHSKIFTTIAFTKILLCIISFLIMLVICITFNVSNQQILTLILLYFSVIGTAIQQTWLFHGLQEMKYITLINLISRTISVILIFLLVKNPSDLFVYCVLYALTSFISGILSLILIKKSLDINLKKITLKEISTELKDGWPIFLTSAMSTLFSGIGITILGFSNSAGIVGVYSAIQKIPYIMIMFYLPIGQAIFPYVSRLYNINLETGLKFVRKVFLFVVPIALVFSILLIYFSDFIIEFLYGKEYKTQSFVIIPLVGWFFFSVVNNLLGIQVLVASGHLKEYSSAFKIGICGILLFNLSLGLLWGVIGVALAVLLAEILLTFSIGYQIKKKLLQTE